MYIASSSTTVKFNEFPSGDLIYNYQPGCKVDGPIRSISWSKDGHWLLLVPEGGRAEIISVRDQLKLLHTITGINQPTCAAFQNTTKKHLAFGTQMGHVLVYDVKTQKIKKTFPRSSSMITHVEFTARDSHLVAASGVGEVILYSNTTSMISSVFKIPKSESVTALKTNPIKRNYVAGGSEEGVVAVWDINANKHKFVKKSHKAPVMGVVFSPVNTELLISTGADRQFSCFDVLSSQCIASVTVPNNITAVDFSPDGTHFVMASQNGNVHLYDSRRIQEPLLSFEAHKSTIRHVSFQKSDPQTNSCSIDDENLETKQSEVEVKTKHDESYLFYMQNSHIEDNVDVADVSMINQSINPCQDSFMVALGINNVTDSFDADGDKNTEPIKEEKLITPLPVAKKNLQDRLSVGDSKRDSNQKSKYLASTPNFGLLRDLQTPISPIICGSSTPGAPQVPNMSLKDIKAATQDGMKEVVKEVVKEELKEMLEGFSQDIKYQFHTSMFQSRKLYLDTLSFMIKEFMKIEDQFNALRDDIAKDGPDTENYLLEENVKLKKKIALLEQQLTARDERP